MYMDGKTKEGTDQDFYRYRMSRRTGEGTDLMQDA